MHAHELYAYACAYALANTQYARAYVRAYTCVRSRHIPFEPLNNTKKKKICRPIIRNFSHFDCTVNLLLSVNVVNLKSEYTPTAHVEGFNNNKTVDYLKTNNKQKVYMLVEEVRGILLFVLLAVVKV